jgi:hypothetical protein
MSHESNEARRPPAPYAISYASSFSYAVVALAAFAYALLPLLDFGIRYVAWRLELPVSAALFDPIIPLGAVVVLLLTASTVARRESSPWALPTMVHGGVAAAIGGAFAQLTADATRGHVPVVPSGPGSPQPAGGMGVSILECYMCPTATDYLMAGLVAGLLAALLALPIGGIARLIMSRKGLLAHNRAG